MPEMVGYQTREGRETAAVLQWVSVSLRRKVVQSVEELSDVDSRNQNYYLSLVGEKCKD